MIKQKMTIRTAALMITVFMMASSVFSSALSEGENFVRARDRLLNDLLEYLTVYEKMERSVLWTTDAFIRYDNEKSWENLQTARAALFIGEQAVSACAFPETELTTDDYFVLMDMDIDISFMEYNSFEFNSDQSDILDFFTLMHYDSTLGILTEEEWEICMKRISFQRRMADFEFKYFALMTDWVMAALNYPETAAEFDRKMAERCPLIYAYRSKEQRDIAQIEEAGDKLLNELELLLQERAEISGATRDSLYTLDDAVEGGNLSGLVDNIIIIGDRPPILPEPEWFDDEDIRFFWMENGTEAPAPEAGIDSLPIPDEWRITIQFVKDSQFQRYLNRLEQIGVVCVPSSGKDGNVIYACEYEGSSFSVIRDGENVHFVMTDDPLLFVPEWYWQAVKGYLE